MHPKSTCDIIIYPLILLFYVLAHNVKISDPVHDKTNKIKCTPSIRPVWSVFLLCAEWIAKDPRFLHADSEDSDHTGRTSRLIWIFAGCTGDFIGFVVLWLKCKSQFEPRHDKTNKVTVRPAWLIWVFGGHTVTLLVLSWGGSFFHFSFQGLYSD